MASRVYNFSAGPAVLPEKVLRQAQDEMLSLPNLGMSVLEISHRSPEFEHILERTKINLRELLAIPENYQILFLQGGGRLQFSMIPMNFARPEQPGSYLVTGSWSQKAVEESRRLVATELLWDGSEERFCRVPSREEFQVPPEAAYVYFTSNETIQGVQFPQEPAVGDTPLICDASSDFLSRPLDVQKYGLIYACAQKNAGPAGATIIILRNDLLAKCGDKLPGYLDYRQHVKENSMFNTPPTFAIYLIRYITDWLIHDVGGLAAMQDQNQRKAALLYDVIDRSNGFYVGHAAEHCRSMMNVTIRLAQEGLQESFLREAAKHQLVNLEGHRSVGGIRASIYNAMPVAGVEQLGQFMQDFASKHS